MCIRDRWETVQDVWDEVAEERAEFEAEAPGSPEREMEFGDLLFALVNVCLLYTSRCV